MSLKTSASMPSLVSCADREVTTPLRTLHLRLISNSSAFRKVRSETDLHKLDKHKRAQFHSDSPANRKLAIKSKHRYNERDRAVQGEIDVNSTRMGGFGVTGGNGGHSNNNNNNNNNNNGDRDGDRDAYYQKMLKAHPGDPLLLRNYARFLHQVKHQAEKAEEYYERAVLANPGDGDVLAMYAKFLWEARNDTQRAQMYFDRAVQAAPDDCYVLASHAHFLWNTEDEEEEEEKLRVPKQHFSMLSYIPSSAAVYS